MPCHHQHSVYTRQHKYSRPCSKTALRKKRMESLQTTSIPSDQEPSSVKHCKRGGWTTFSFIIGESFFSLIFLAKYLSHLLFSVNFTDIVYTGAVMGLTLAAGAWSSNLIVFLVNVMNIKSINASQINNIILGSYSLFPIAGAVIADSFFSSFHVVSVFASVSLLVSLCSL